MKTSAARLVRCVACLTVLLGIAAVRGAEWTGTPDLGSGPGTDWNTAGNWDPSGVPGVGVLADCRMTGADYTINYGTAMSAGKFGQLLIDNDVDHTTTLNIDAGGFISDPGTSNLNIGDTGVINVNSDGYAEFKASGSFQSQRIDGALTVDGGDARISGGSYFYSDGTITVKNDGYLKIASFLNYIGNSMTLSSGEIETGSNQFRIGYYNYSSGTLTMTGGTLNLNSYGGTYLSWNNKSGTMNISGGEVNSYYPLHVGSGNYHGAGGYLTLSGGEWTQINGGLVTVGEGSGGSSNQLNITGSGVFTTTGDTTLGADSASGTMTVNGGTYTATNDDGDATLTVNRGELKMQSGTLTVDRLIASASTSSAVTFDGGTMVINDSSTVSNGSTFQVGNGTDEALLVLNGNHTFADGLTVTNNASLQGAGTISGGMTSVAGGGTLIPGNSIDTLHFANDLTVVANAGYNYEISSPDVHDLVDVDGELTLPGAGETVFVNISLIAPKKTLSPTEVELFTYGTLSGDADLVDWDINLIGGYWLSTPTVYDNGSGTIFLSGVSFIPEPASVALLGLGALFLLKRNRILRNGSRRDRS